MEKETWKVGRPARFKVFLFFSWCGITLGINSAASSATRADSPCGRGEQIPLCLFTVSSILTLPLCKIGRFVSVFLLSLEQQLLFFSLKCFVAVIGLLKRHLLRLYYAISCVASEAFRSDFTMKCHLLLLLSAPTCFSGSGCVPLGFYLLILWSWCSDAGLLAEVWLVNAATILK